MIHVMAHDDVLLHFETLPHTQLMDQRSLLNLILGKGGGKEVRKYIFESVVQQTQGDLKKCIPGLRDRQWQHLHYKTDPKHWFRQNPIFQTECGEDLHCSDDKLSALLRTQVYGTGDLRM